MYGLERPTSFFRREISRRAAIARWGLGAAAALAFGPTMACSESRSAQPQGDPISDDAFLLHILTKPRPLIPQRQRPYRITRTLPIASGQTVLIEAGTRIIWEGPTKKDGGMVAVFEAMGDNTALAVSGTGVAFVECETPSPLVYAATMRGHRGFSVTGIQAIECQHVRIDSTVLDYKSVRTQGPNSTIGYDVRISGGGARYRERPKEGNGACYLAYVANAHVSDVRYENVQHGIQWWGGDAGLGKQQDGLRANERKCTGILIERASIQNATVGGIWGSMGSGVVVRDCSVEECGDVGFDAEGCNDVTFERCTARNGHNGCFTTFALCDGIRFVDCRGVVDNKAYPLFRIYNVSQSSVDNRNISIIGGRFECLDPTGPSALDSALGPVRELTITNATLSNVRILTVFLNMHSTRIAGNVLTFPFALPAGPAILAGGTQGTPEEPGGAIIENNRIHYTAASSPNAAIAIQIIENGFNANASSKVVSNIVSGPFAIGIALINASGNPGIVPQFEVSGNRFTRLPASARLLKVSQGTPQAKPPAVRWNPTQVRNGAAISLRAALGQSR